MVADAAAPAKEARRSAGATKPPHAGEPWDADEDQRLKAAFAVGKSVAELAREHGRTNRAIEARLWRMGLLRPV